MENSLGHRLLILSMYMSLIRVVVVLLYTRPQVNLLLNLGGGVRRRDSSFIHIVSALPLMVTYMYVIVRMEEFRFSDIFQHTMSIVLIKCDILLI